MCLLTPRFRSHFYLEQETLRFYPLKANSHQLFLPNSLSVSKLRKSMHLQTQAHLVSLGDCAHSFSNFISVSFLFYLYFTIIFQLFDHFHFYLSF